MTASCLLADGDPLFRSALRVSLTARSPVEIVGEAGSAASAVSMLDDEPVDLLVVAANLPGGGLDVCRQVVGEARGVKVLVLGGDDPRSGLLSALEVGAHGYIDRRQSLEEVLDAVRRVLDGEAYVPPGMLAPLLRRLIDNNREADRVLHLFMSLTRRERQILELLVDGCSPAEVAEILVVAPQTARSHIQNVIGKFGVHSRAEVVALASEHGLLDRMQRGGA